MSEGVTPPALRQMRQGHYFAMGVACVGSVFLAALLLLL